MNEDGSSTANEQCQLDESNERKAEDQNLLHLVVCDPHFKFQRFVFRKFSLQENFRFNTNFSIVSFNRDLPKQLRCVKAWVFG